MDFAAQQTALKAWIKLVHPGASITVEVTDAKRPFEVPATFRIEFDEPAIVRSIGRDWTTVADSITGPVFTVHGNRELEITIRARGRSHTPNASPQWAIEELRVSLKKPSCLSILRAAGIAIVKIGATASYNAPRDGRVEPISAFVLTIGTAVASVDANTSGQVDQVAISSAISGTAGALLPEPPNYTDEIIGEL